jgi:hypothetical protein
MMMYLWKMRICLWKMMMYLWKMMIYLWTIEIFWIYVTWPEGKCPVWGNLFHILWEDICWRFYYIPFFVWWCEKIWYLPTKWLGDVSQLWSWWLAPNLQIAPHSCGEVIFSSSSILLQSAHKANRL